MANVLPLETRVRIVSCLVEGCSLRATARLCGVAFNSVLKFVPLIGQACSDYQDKALRNLRCERLELDEQWNFCHAKDKNLPKDKQGKFGYGSVWTWLAVDAQTRLVPCWFIGDRSTQSAMIFLDDLKSRVVNRPQISSDGHSAYLAAVENAFGSDADFAQVIKIFSSEPSVGGHNRYSPPPCTGTRKQAVSGNPDMSLVSTSYAERLNLSMRMNNRRCTRLTNAHSKKVENHAHALSLFFMAYNYCKIHQTLRMTPAMAAGVTDHVWEISEVVALLDKQSDVAAA